MFSALSYLLLQSARNRLIRRIKRLKQPKYLIGAIVGGLYFYYYFFRFMFGSGMRFGPRGGTGIQPDESLYESIGALILLVIVLLAWVLPRKRAALTFTEAEIAFLFPAPVSRRMLIHFKLMRSQAAILFTVFFLTLISWRGGGPVWIRAAGWWLILMTLNLHFLGSSFTVTMLMDRGISNWKRRVAVITLAVVVAGAVIAWAVHALPPLNASNLSGPEAMMDYAKLALVSGPLPYLLYPFRLLVRPYHATDALGFVRTLWPALLLMGAHYWWVIRSDVAFEESSVEASQRLAEKVAAVRAGKWQMAGRKLKGKRPPFKLKPGGPQPVALLWKNLLAAGHAFTARMWLALVWIVVVMIFAMHGAAGGSSWLPVVGGIAAMLGVWAILIGPHIVRQDLRQDIPLADQLKLYPMRGWQVVLGEILAPATILTGIEWLLLLLAVGVFTQAQLGKVPGSLVPAIGLGVAIIVPTLNFISLLIPNAAVLLFPAWFQTGKDSPQGIEATGQRLIFAIGQFLAFAVALIPAAIVAVAIFLFVKFAAGIVVAVPVAAVAAALVLAVEAGLGVMWLGWLFERFDVSAEATT